MRQFPFDPHLPPESMCSGAFTLQKFYIACDDLLLGIPGLERRSKSPISPRHPHLQSPLWKRNESIAMINYQLYPGSAWLVDPSLQVDQVSTESFSQLIEKSQIERNPEQGIKYTKHLPRHCAGGQVSITCKR